MKELTFKSNLTMEQIEHNFAEMDFFSELMDGLEEALAYSKGKAYAETFVRKRSLPSVNVVEIRESLQMTQKSFASILGVSRRTVEAWETRKRCLKPPRPYAVFIQKTLYFCDIFSRA